jgi:hypothetical protein
MRETPNILERFSNGVFQPPNRLGAVSLVTLASRHRFASSHDDWASSIAQVRCARVQVKCSASKPRRGRQWNMLNDYMHDTATVVVPRSRMP